MSVAWDGVEERLEIWKRHIFQKEGELLKSGACC